MINVEPIMKDEELLMISKNPGIVKYAAMSGANNQEKIPPLIQKLSQLHPFTFL
jgi:hypothetical protein